MGWHHRPHHLHRIATFGIATIPAALSEVGAIAAGVRNILDSRAAGIAEQLAELNALRGKNQDVVEHMMARVREEKATFERGLARYSALRNVFTQQTTELFDRVGLDRLRANAGDTRRSIEASLFTRGLRTAMNDFFSTIRADLEAAGAKAGEIHELMRAMYARFAKEHNLELYEPPPFSATRPGRWAGVFRATIREMTG